MSELPKGWEIANLEDCIEILDSQRKPINNKERKSRVEGKEESELYPYFGATGKVGYIDAYLFNGEYVALGEDAAPFFDPLKTKAYMLNGKTWVNNHAHVLNGMRGISNKYLCYLLNQFDYHGYVNGATRLKLTQANMRKMPLLIAPLNEQKRIADKLDSLLAKVDKAQARLDKIPTILKRFRQSVLASATSGELTKEWRNKHLEEKWQSVELLDVIISKPRNGKSPKGVDYETSVKNLTLSAVTLGYFVENKFKYVDIDVPSDSHLWLKKGDILIQRANSIDYVGVSAVYEGDDDRYIYPDLMMKCQANEKILTKYLHYSLLSEPVRKYFRNNATGTSGNMPKINQGIVSSAPINLPKLKEQKEIVNKVEALFAKAELAEKQYKEAKARIDRLTQSILAKAFRGELVPQDENDEPAEQLLARIQASMPKLKAKAKKKAKPAKKGA